MPNAKGEGFQVPRPDSFDDINDWARTTAQVMQKQVGTPDDTPSIGLLVLYQGTPPQGVLPADGSAFDPKVYRSLAAQLGASNTPNVPAPTGYKFGVIAG